VQRTVARLCADAGARLGEGPSWDDERQRLVWVDILAGRVHVCDGTGRESAVLDVGTHVGAALPALGGGWLLATPTGFTLLDEDGTAQPLLDVHVDRPELRFNDAKCDPGGRALAGTMRYDQAPGDGALYRLESGPRAVPLLQGRGLCNGLGWRPDGRVLYFVDSLTSTIAAHPYDPDRGTIGPGSELVRIDPAQGLPDGLCVDDEGCLWLALYGGGCVHRYRPDGRLAAVIELPVPCPTSVAFGGPARDRLFITTAGGTGDGNRGSELGAGGLWVAEPGVTGPAATPWRPVRVDAPPFTITTRQE
jgi:sugar lactone lactonase YvrE